MTGNDTFYEKSNTQYKVSKAYDLVLLFLKKKKIFVLGVAHGDPIFTQVGSKNSNF